MAEVRPLTPEEVVKHPEYEHLIWDLKPTQKGKVAVAKNRGGAIDIAYEVHGHGDRHLVVSPPCCCRPQNQRAATYSVSKRGYMQPYPCICHI